MTPEERLDRIEGIVEKHNAGIRDLIVVSRTVLTSIEGLGTSVQGLGTSMKEMDERHEKDHQRFMADMEKLREAQAETGQKLNILIDTVDRIIRNSNRNN